jgi:predicted lipoprotein with Yx(FWY)xxD motif
MARRRKSLVVALTTLAACAAIARPIALAVREAGRQSLQANPRACCGMPAMRCTGPTRQHDRVEAGIARRQVPMGQLPARLRRSTGCARSICSRVTSRRSAMSPTTSSPAHPSAATMTASIGRRGCSNAHREARRGFPPLRQAKKIAPEGDFSLFWRRGWDSVTSRDPARACRPEPSNAHREARRGFPPLRQAKKIAPEGDFSLFWRRGWDSVTSRDPARACRPEPSNAHREARRGFPPLRQAKKIAPEGDFSLFWRRGWDSNPRMGRPIA